MKIQNLSVVLLLSLVLSGCITNPYSRPEYQATFNTLEKARQFQVSNSANEALVLKELKKQIDDKTFNAELIQVQAVAGNFYLRLAVGREEFAAYEVNQYYLDCLIDSKHADFEALKQNPNLYPLKQSYQISGKFSAFSQSSFGYSADSYTFELRDCKISELIIK